ncbi:MAG: histone [Planctomycetota bacterium]
MSEVFVIASKIKKMIKEQGMRTGGDAIEALSKIVEEKAKAAVQKAKDAGKKTIQASDIQ